MHRKLYSITYFLSFGLSCTTELFDASSELMQFLKPQIFPVQPRNVIQTGKLTTRKTIVCIISLIKERAKNETT